MVENKDLDELDKKFDEASYCGRNLQKMGRRLVSASEQGKEVISDIRQDKDALENLKVKSWLAAANATIPACPTQELKQLEPYYYAVTTSTSSASAIVLDYTFHSRKDFELSDDDKEELDEHLKEFSKDFPGTPDLAKIRLGAWETFYSETEVNLMNASHSMREILRHIISRIASNEEVKQSSWWEKPQDTDKDVTSQQRLRFLIFGPGDDKPTELAAMTISNSFKAYSRLQAIAHGSQGIKHDVKEYMQITEHTLLTILRYRKLRAV